MMVYRVNDIYTSIQGEGCLTGVPMILLRLQGCLVGCAFCDTKETWHADSRLRMATMPEALGQNARWAEMTAPAIAAYVYTNHRGPKWVLITGGEPAAQDLTDLVAHLHDMGYRVALETSGTALGHINAACDWVCVSPKLGNPGHLPVLLEAVMSADEIKHVVGKMSDVDQLDDLLASFPIKPGVTICLQPMSQNPRATALCMEIATQRGWRLSIQTHKLLAVR